MRVKYQVNYERGPTTQNEHTRSLISKNPRDNTSIVKKVICKNKKQLALSYMLHVPISMQKTSEKDETVMHGNHSCKSFKSVIMQEKPP
jgi:hypothetical protein